MMDELLNDAARQLLADQCTPAVVRAIEAGGPHAALWQQIEDAGFADALANEEAGGAGLGLADVFGMLELCGSYALPVPLGETMLARGLLAAAGIARPPGSIALAHATRAAVSGIASAPVGGGRVADHVLVQCDGQTRLMRAADATASDAVFPLDVALRWPLAAWNAAPQLSDAIDIRSLIACVYAAQLAGALMAVFQRTLAHANEREQFGRPIGKFQAIQHQLSVISEHAFAARMAAQIGCRADGIVPDRLCVAVAKARTSEAALEVAALAHAIHGAIGFTAEFDLQIFTRRLHLWRQAGGSESYWHDVVGAALLDGEHAMVLELIRGVTDIH